MFRNAVSLYCVSKEIDAFRKKVALIGDALKEEEEEEIVVVDEKELLEWTNGNRKDIIYLLWQDLLSKDPRAIARASRMIEETIDYMDNPNSP